MDKSVVLIALLILLSVGIYSCKDEDSDDDTSGVTTQDRDFTVNASNANKAEIEFGQLAVQKAVNDSVVAYAQKMIVDHTAARNQLDSIAGNLNITLPDSMDITHRTLYSGLSQMTGPAFDSAYINIQVFDHQATRNLLQDQIDNGDDSRLVDYATKQLPVVSMHLQEALKFQPDTTSGGGVEPY